jgi:myo-inositol 2-dehydrogenase / D-chiro-inositol 1-dehydrogenase
VTYAHWPVSGLRLHLVDMSIHAIDLVRWMLGDPVRMSIYKRAIQDCHVIEITLEHSSKAVSQLDLSAFQPGVKERLEVTGENAVVRVENMAEVTYVRQRSGTADEAPNHRVTTKWAPELTIPDRENDRLVLQGYAPELIAFADAIREGRAVDPSIEDGVAAMRLIEAVIAAPEGLSMVELSSQAGVWSQAR